jgi:hypothetical protein
MHTITTTFAMAAVVLGFCIAQAQDIAGMENCTKTNGLNRRTSCLQSNIEYLNKVIAKNAADGDNKLNAAIAEVNALRTMVATLQSDIQQLQNVTKTK